MPRSDHDDLNGRKPDDDLESILAPSDPGKTAAEEALDAIAAISGCEEWWYPAQVVRDVKALAGSRWDGTGSPPTEGPVVVDATVLRRLSDAALRSARLEQDRDDYRRIADDAMEVNRRLLAARKEAIDRLADVARWADADTGVSDEEIGARLRERLASFDEMVEERDTARASEADIRKRWELVTAYNAERERRQLLEKTTADLRAALQVERTEVARLRAAAAEVGRDPRDVTAEEDEHLRELAEHVAGLSAPEPAPRRTDGPPVWDLVIADMRERDQEGRRKYGTPLQAFNGRRPLVDAYQEALDLAVYLRQAIEEAASPPCGDAGREYRCPCGRVEALEDVVAMAEPAREERGEQVEERERGQVDPLANQTAVIGPEWRDPAAAEREDRSRPPPGYRLDVDLPSYQELGLCFPRAIGLGALMPRDMALAACWAHRDAVRADLVAAPAEQSQRERDAIAWAKACEKNYKTALEREQELLEWTQSLGEILWPSGESQRAYSLKSIKGAVERFQAAIMEAKDAHLSAASTPHGEPGEVARAVGGAMSQVANALFARGYPVKPHTSLETVLRTIEGVHAAHGEPGETTRAAEGEVERLRGLLASARGEQGQTPDDRERAIVRRLVTAWGDIEVVPDAETVDGLVSVIGDTGKVLAMYARESVARQPTATSSPAAPAEPPPVGWEPVIEWLDREATRAAEGVATSADKGDDLAAAHLGGRAKAFRAAHDYVREAARTQGSPAEPSDDLGAWATRHARTLADSTDDDLDALLARRVDRASGESRKLRTQGSGPDYQPAADDEVFVTVTGVVVSVAPKGAVTVEVDIGYTEDDADVRLLVWPNDVRLVDAMARTQGSG